MTLVIPPLHAQISMQIRNANDPEPWYCTWGANCQDMNDDLVEIGKKACEAFSVWLTWFSEDVTVEGAQVAYGAVLDQEPIRAFVPNPTVSLGTHDVPKLPQNCALLVKKITARGGRQHRGRFFLPGMLTEEGVSNVGVIAAADLPSYQGGADEMLDILNTGTNIMPMVILHNSTPIPVPDPTPVTRLLVDNVISTQRRRLR